MCATQILCGDRSSSLSFDRLARRTSTPCTYLDIVLSPLAGIPLRPKEIHDARRLRYVLSGKVVDLLPAEKPLVVHLPAINRTDFDFVDCIHNFTPGEAPHSLLVKVP